MMVPEPKERESGEVLDQELEKPVAKGIKAKNQEPELQSMVLRVVKCKYKVGLKKDVSKILLESNTQS